MSSVEDVRILFPKDLEELLTFEEVGEYIVIKPRQFLGSDKFAKVASIIKQNGGEYISAGKQSRFQVKRGTSQKPQLTLLGRLETVKAELESIIKIVREAGH